MNRLQQVLSRLDRLPFPGALVLGALAGIGLGALGVVTGTYGLWGAAAAGALAPALGLTAQPVWVTEASAK